MSKRTERTIEHVRNRPMSGDVIEIVEKQQFDDGEPFDAEVMLRVIAVHEEKVWFKEYGKGHYVKSVADWKRRLGDAKGSKLIRGGGFDAPF